MNLLKTRNSKVNRSKHLIRGAIFALILAIFTSALSGLMAPQAANAATTLTQSVSLSPVADSYVSSTQATTNFGTQAMVKAQQSKSQTFRSYFKFNVATVNPNNPTVSAKLRVYVKSASVDGGTIYLAGNSWSETALTWNNRPGLLGAGVDHKTNVATGSWVEFNVTSLVNKSGTYSFGVVSSDSNAVNYASKENTKFVPQLVVTQKQFDRPGRKPGLTRVALIGDSITNFYGPTTVTALQSEGYSALKYGYAGKGILDADWCNGQKTTSIINDFDPDIVVYENIGNYNAPNCDPSVAYDSPEFYSAWQQEAQLNSNLLTARGVRTYWLLNPPVPYPDGVLISNMYTNIAANTSNVGTIDAYLPFGGDTPDWSLRTPDQVHLSNTGITLMSALVNTAIQTPSPVTPSTP